MTRLAELLVAGVSLGAIYALVAVGFVVIYKGTRVINFAQGSMLLLGGYVVATLSPEIGFWAAVPVGAAVSGLAAVTVRLLMSLSRSEDHMVLTIVTIGVDVVLATELIRRIGPRLLTMDDPWGDGVLQLGPVTVPQARIAATVTAAVLLAGFFAVFAFTDWGVTMRAAADDPETASLMGIRLGRVATLSWLLGGALAAVAGVYLAAFPSAGLDSHAGVVALGAVPAVILGGLDSTHGAVVGALVIGLVESLVNGYGAELAFLGRGFGSVAPYLVMAAVLLWRPSGLFGTRELARV